MTGTFEAEKDVKQRNPCRHCISKEQTLPGKQLLIQETNIAGAQNQTLMSPTRNVQRVKIGTANLILTFLPLTEH